MPRERLNLGELGNINYTKLSAGGWLAYAYYRDSFGKRRKLSATGATKPKATTALKAKAHKNLASAAPNRQVSVKQAAEDWLASLPTAGLKPATIRTYTQATERHIIPLAGALTIHELTTSRVTELLHTIVTPRQVNGETIGGPTPARHARVALGLIYKRLIHDGLIDQSPVTYANTPKEPRKLVERVLDVGEIRRIRAHIIDWGKEGAASGPDRDAQRLLDFVDVLAGTGMRPGEVLALRWGDVDLDVGVIYVRSTLTRVKGVGLVAQPTPKSLYSQRGLAVPPFVLAVLQRRAQEAGWPGESVPVFATRNGTFISDSNMRRLWRSAAKGRFEGVWFADYRKAVATLIERAEGMEAAGKALGHSSPEITRRYYVARQQVVDYREVLEGVVD